jgi:hypothetical protein
LRALREGPLRRGQIAELLNIEPVTYSHDIEELRRQYKSENRKAPPRRATIVYPQLSGTLNYMSRRKHGKPEDLPYFDELYKPLIRLENRKWYITEWGENALKKLDSLTD